MTIQRRTFLRSLLALASVSLPTALPVAQVCEVPQELPMGNIIPGVWHRVVYSIGSGKVKLYLDGMNVRDVDGLEHPYCFRRTTRMGPMAAVV